MLIGMENEPVTEPRAQSLPAPIPVGQTVEVTSTMDKGRRGVVKKHLFHYGETVGHTVEHENDGSLWVYNQDALQAV